MLQVLQVQKLDKGLYQGVSLDKDRPYPIYGGQLLAQALSAAFDTLADDRLAHSLHFYFLRAGDADLPVQYRATSSWDGRSFAVRQVDVLQQNKIIGCADISFQTVEDGLNHQADAPENIPDPDSLYNCNDPAILQQQAEETGAGPVTISHDESIERNWIDMRRLAPFNVFREEKRAPCMDAWMRIRSPLPDSPRLQQVALIYLSDWSLLDSSLGPYGTCWGDDLRPLSLDHAIWFHAPARADKWLLFMQHSVKITGARGLNRGKIFSPDNKLVASLAQEALVRDNRVNSTTESV